MGVLVEKDDGVENTVGQLQKPAPRVGTRCRSCTALRGSFWPGWTARRRLSGGWRCRAEAGA
jgi:hypothetical protein